MLNGLTEQGRARAKIKIIEVNFPACTCHAKCSGPTGLFPRLEDLFYTKNIAPLHFTVNVCGHCRRAHNIENTTSQKPRELLVSQNPGLTACSSDACAIIRHIPLVELVINETTVRYAHRFYTTNAENVVGEVFNGERLGAAGRMFGVCFLEREDVLKNL